MPTGDRQHRAVLVVDDDAVSRMVVSGLVRRGGHAVDTAIDGLEAVEAAARRRYDLVLMDLQMPELDGFEAARRMRALETRPRRIVALTATIDDATAARCADVGIDELAEKPLTAERVEALLALAGSIATAASAPDDVDAVDETLSAEVFDRFRRETAAHLTRSFEEVVGSLLVEIRRQATELASAVDRDDRDAIGRAAHRLRGSTATLGATRLALRTQELERSAATASASALTATLAFTLAEIDAIEHAIGRRLGG